MDNAKLAEEIETLASKIEKSKGPAHRAWIKLKKAAALIRAGYPKAKPAVQQDSKSSK